MLKTQNVNIVNNEFLSNNITENKDKGKKKQVGLKVAYTNADQLPNKMSEVELFLNENNIDLIGICEVLPKEPGHNISSFVIEGYTPYPSLEGRGICVFVKNNINITIVELTNIECIFKPSVFLKITSNKSSFTLGLIYRSPNCSDEENESINSQISSAAKYSLGLGEDLVIMGDFNYPKINWSKESCSQAESYRYASSFLEKVHK